MNRQQDHSSPRVSLSWGDRISLATLFLTPAIMFGAWAIGVHTDLRIVAKDIDRHETLLNKLANNQENVIHVLDKLEAHQNARLEIDAREATAKTHAHPQAPKEFEP
jgi:hypothetical protein